MRDREVQVFDWDELARVADFDPSYLKVGKRDVIGAAALAAAS